jgi:hypothetical protein
VHDGHAEAVERRAAGQDRGLRSAQMLHNLNDLIAAFGIESGAN